MDGLTEGLGARWLIETNGHKPYACGVVLHPLIDAAIAIRAREPIDPAAVSEIGLRVHPLVLSNRMGDMSMKVIQLEMKRFEVRMSEQGQRRKLDKSIKKKYDRFRRRYPEVHGKVANFITHSIEDGTLYFSVREEKDGS